MTDGRGVADQVHSLIYCLTDCPDCQEMEECEGGVVEECEGGVVEECEGGVVEECEGGVVEECEGGVVEGCEGGVVEEYEGGVVEGCEGGVVEGCEESVGVVVVVCFTSPLHASYCFSALLHHFTTPCLVLFH
ncbi:hypothetical protein Pmani_021516 [Petrolisthes manimaculis]|uniref:Uncharacterized protein n=1 Tax=Petrolisthes manimaculis TaxID=1843537 RepID=A0AAE1PGI6_9EUCA|nr:hypothetical protein Pmani_021516 [Petrolisthes manimaculis]